MKKLSELSEMDGEDKINVNNFMDCQFDTFDVKKSINNAFVVSTSKTIPHKTQLSIKNIPVELKEVEFEVTTKDCEGNTTHSASDDLQVEISGPNNEIIGASLIDHTNGSHTGSFKPMLPGKYHISIAIRGSKVWRSPTTVFVSRDYRAVCHAQNGFPLRRESGQFAGPSCAAVNSDGKIMVADTQNHRIQLFDAQGNLLKIFGEEGKCTGQFRFPVATAFLSDGSLVVLDGKNCRVQIFSPEGQFLRHFGKEGGGLTEFYCPLGLSIDSGDRIIVSDTGNKCVKVFDSMGKLLLHLGQDNPGKLQNPQSATYSKGYFLVADTYVNGLHIYSDNGELVNSEFSRSVIEKPYHVSVDKNGFLIICERDCHHIKVVDHTGKLVIVFGAHGTAEGYFLYPRSAVPTEKGQIVVADWGNSRVQIF
ncbi:hypothetical protein QZH41_002445 [Actinostola sp. cb2023]|nr:hypothetical protein QZH41_002445 [Actinostola sp. cb2023]